MLTKAPLFLEERKKATQTLAKSGKRLIFCEAILLLILTFLAGIFIINVTAVLESYFPLNKNLIGAFEIAFLALVIAFLWFPINYGLVKISNDLTKEKSIVLTDIFSPYTDKNCHRVRHLCCKSVLEWVLFYGIAHHTHTLLAKTSKIDFLWFIAILLELFIFLLFHNRNFYLAYVMMEYPEKSRKELVAMAHSLYLENMFAPFVFFLSLVPELVLGALTIGVLWILSLFPETPISYVHFCKTMIKNQSLAHLQEEKETKNV